MASVGGMRPVEMTRVFSFETVFLMTDHDCLQERMFAYENKRAQTANTSF